MSLDEGPDFRVITRKSGPSFVRDRESPAGTGRLPRRVTTPLVREFARRGAGEPEMIARLSAAEWRVVAVLSSGTTSNEQIAERLRVSVHTVRSQMQSALKKLDMDDRTQLALWGSRNHLDRDADSFI